MRVPVYFRQCRSEAEIKDFLQKYGACAAAWPEYLLAGVLGERHRFRACDGIDAKCVFYDDREPDYEPGVWPDRIRLFEGIKAEVSRMPCDDVMAEYFLAYGITDPEAVFADRVPCTGWDAPRFFQERGLTGFDSMFDCEQYMRYAVIGRRIFRALDTDDKIFRRAERIFL